MFSRRLCRLSHNLLTGELGWEIHHDAKHTAQLYHRILEAGSLYDIKDVGTYAVNSLRLEKGFRGWGAEVIL